MPEIIPSDARELARRLEERREQAPVGNALLDRLDGDQAPELFRRLVAVEAQCHSAEMIAYGTMLARFPRRPAADLFIRLSRLVCDAQPKLRKCADALDMPDPFESFWPPGRETYAFNGTLSWVANQGSQASFALSSYTDMVVYFSGCSALVRRVRELRIDAPAEFIEYYDDDASDELTELALDVAQDGLGRGDDPQDALFQARLLEESIGDFWRSAANVS
ncbi:hypothetical protein B1H20_02220 [Streptomyces violaceoruber]|uniref:Uncharacterized protein n=1 Tax=Streptomyces violaceoruber TaxID=1935 RepID=A0A1V0U5V0_STRVN|nr:hypothetical protein [Streptomyces violaceoruber]ARF60332.1 hypothetical protein B1H20_02220 [Streptomyces violaceoruber]